MKNINIGDIISVVCLVLAVSFIDFDKEAIKAFITGGVIIWWMMRRVKA